MQREMLGSDCRLARGTQISLPLTLGPLQTLNRAFPVRTGASGGHRPHHTPLAIRCPQRAPCCWNQTKLQLNI